MKDFSILDRNLDVFGNHFLEASAGTGKTFALENLVCRLLLHPEKAIPIERILVVTFTKASTRELKARIRANLEKIKRALLYDPSSLDYIMDLQEKGEVFVKDALLKIEDALTNFTQAQIFTIHGFCYRMLEEFAFTADIGFHIADVEDFSYKAITKKRLRDFLRIGLGKRYHFSQVDKVLRREKYDIDKFSDKILKLMDKRASFPEPCTFEEGIKQVRESLKEIQAEYLPKQTELLEDYKKLASCYKKMTSPLFVDQVSFLGKIWEENTYSNQEITSFLTEESLFLEGMEEGNKKVKASFPDSLHYPGLFGKLRSKVYPIFSKLQDPSSIFLAIAFDFQTLWSQKRENSEVFSPDDILRKMEESVDNPEFVKKVQSKFDAVVIDEFQDTDIAQWKIFKTLFLDRKNPLACACFVGDPKQSIYSFRKADLYTYLQAKEEVGDASILRTNFRSQVNLVKALNRLFSSETLQSWIRLPSLNHEIKYHPVNPSPFAKEELFEDGKGSVHFFIAEGFLGRERQWPNQDMEENCFFPFLAKEILYWKKQVPAKEIAVLVRDRFQAKRLFSFLKKRKISSSLKRSDSLSESPIFFAIQELFQAIIEYADVSCIKRVLGNRLVGFSEKEIRGGLENPILEKASAYFYQLGILFQKEGPGGVLYAFLKSIWKEEKTILENLILSQELSFQQDYMQILHLITEHALEKKASLEQILDFFKEFENKGPEEDGRMRRVLAEEEDAITIMTMHMSKGLEFEIVFALGLVARTTAEEEFIVVKEGEVERIETAEMAKESARSVFQEWDAEKMRQLYVALTRAKRRVYIPYALDLENKPVSLGKASPMELFIARWGEDPVLEEDLYSKITQINRPFLISALENMKDASISYSFAEKEKMEPAALFSSQQDLISPPEVFFPSSTKMIGSYSSFAKQVANTSEFEEKKAALQEEKNMMTLPMGAHTGTLLHAILEDLFRLGLHKPLQVEKIRALLQKKVVSTPLENWKEALEQSILELLKKPLTQESESFCLCDIEPEKIQVETEFMFLQSSTYVKGTIDMVFEREGKYYFLDWKSNYLGPSLKEYERPSLEKAMHEHHYFLQASIYQDALSRYLSNFHEKPFLDVFGGCFYVFLRGPSIYHFIPEKWQHFDRMETKDLIWNE